MIRLRDLTIYRLAVRYRILLVFQLLVVHHLMPILQINLGGAAMLLSPEPGVLETVE